MKTHLSILCSFLIAVNSPAQDTFSIVAVDTMTGEIGSAGASCVGPINGVGAFILSDVIEGIGAIHTQASYLATNQQTAHNRMLLGDSPQQIIDYMVSNDAQGNPTVRQYGIVDLTRAGESAAYTGVNCTDYKNHVTGPGYAVQGNILLGQVIIDTMRNVFLGTPGPVADRLMKSLEAAKIIGADTRCASRNTSSRSSFIKVVRIGDGNTPYLQLVVPDSPVGNDPIDILRTQFDQWKDSLSSTVDPFLSQVVLDVDTLPANGSAQAVITVVPKNNSDTLLASGRVILLTNSGNGVIGPVTDLGNGTYAATITSPQTPGVDTIHASVVSGADTVQLAMKPHMTYIDPNMIEEGEVTVPENVVLYQNYPNPFNPSTTIVYKVPIRDRSDSSPVSSVRLNVFDLLGRHVATLVDENLTAGTYRLTFNASDLAGGVYYYQLNVGKTVSTRKLVLLR